MQFSILTLLAFTNVVLAAPLRDERVPAVTTPLLNPAPAKSIAVVNDDRTSKVVRNTLVVGVPVVAAAGGAWWLGNKFLGNKPEEEKKEEQKPAKEAETPYVPTNAPPSAASSTQPPSSSPASSGEPSKPATTLVENELQSYLKEIDTRYEKSLEAADNEEKRKELIKKKNKEIEEAKTAFASAAESLKDQEKNDAFMKALNKARDTGKDNEEDFVTRDNMIKRSKVSAKKSQATISADVKNYLRKQVAIVLLRSNSPDSFPYTLKFDTLDQAMNDPDFLKILEPYLRSYTGYEADMTILQNGELMVDETGYFTLSKKGERVPFELEKYTKEPVVEKKD